jgi:hypothetical protein
MLKRESGSLSGLEKKTRRTASTLHPEKKNQGKSIINFTLS